KVRRKFEWGLILRSIQESIALGKKEVFGESVRKVDSISNRPEIRRDRAFIINESVPPKGSIRICKRLNLSVNLISFFERI
ncbi:hypothetical protein, partial [Labilibaculum sp.]|uniref:hypothetical protein n=1 Tax=Labilibaculum sp. TaxID=2060723 RepID=UPI00356ABA8C